MENQTAIKKWSRLYNQCVVCGTNEKRHYACGLDFRCYHRLLVRHTAFLNQLRRENQKRVEKNRIQAMAKGLVSSDRNRVRYWLSRDREVNNYIKVLKKTTQKCKFCGVKMTEFGMAQKSIDYIIPLNSPHNGLHTQSNVQIICLSCNLHKRAMLDEVFKAKLAERGQK